MEFIMKSTILAGLAITLLALPGCFKAAKSDNPIPQLLSNHGGNAVIMFHKSGCPFSGYLSPIFDQVAQSYKNKLFMQKITVSHKNQSIFKNTYGFSTFPTVAYFKNNKLVKKHGSGNRSYSQEKIKGHIQDIYGL